MNIIIVGASSGIGMATAREFLRLGHRVGVAARRTAPLLALQAEYPTQVVFAAIDINAPEAATRLLQLAEELGGMDVYLHSSGVGHENKELNPDIELDIVQTNGAGFMRMVTAAFRYWTSRGQRGHLAAITSVAGTRGLGISPAYSATKRMQSQYLEALSQISHQGHHDIAITDILPGFVRTDFIAKRNYPMVISPEKTARHIVKGILHRRRRIVIDWRYRVLIALWSALPRYIWERLPFP